MASPSATPTQSPTVHETLAILPSFLQLLRSPAPLKLPSETLLGAITHFLSQLESPHLEEFVKALIGSPSLWTSSPTEEAASTSASTSRSNLTSTSKSTSGPTLVSSDEIRDAIRLSVSSKLSQLQRETNDLYFAKSRLKRRAQSWLYTLIRAAEEVEDAKGKVHLCIGLLRGLDDSPSLLDWGKARVWLEEDVVFQLAEKMQGLQEEQGSREEIRLLCEVVPHINAGRLWALDLKRYVADIKRHLLDSIPGSHAGTTEKDSAAAARALARSIEVLHSGGPASRHYALEAMYTFCDDMHGVGLRFEEEWIAREFKMEASVEDEAWARHKTALFSFLLPASTILDILLSTPSLDSTPASRSNHQRLSSLSVSSELAVRILNTIASFAYLPDESVRELENYHRIIYGCLDILAADTEHGPRALEILLSSIQGVNEGPISDSRAAFALVVGEQLVHQLSSKCIDRLLPLAERHVHRLKHRGSFEAAHAFLLRLLVTSTESSNTGSLNTQGDFFDALLPNYLAILTKQAKRGDISSDQLKAVFPMITESASKRSTSSVNLCLSYLAALPSSPETRMIRIIITPYVLSTDLPAYLGDVAQLIMSAEAGSEERLDLVRRAYEMVVKDLGDDVKSIGVRWWSEYADEFEGRRHNRDIGWVRSRL